MSLSTIANALAVDEAMCALDQLSVTGYAVIPELIEQDDIRDLIHSLPASSAGTRGGAMLMRPLLLHASSKVTVDSTRRVLHFVFGPEHLPVGLRWPPSR